ncbi:MAG: helix-turn-helix domain-containing protein [Taibaiella sp.]|nr:helix-turn-helix domain-containing protein [Taibaiella sp.]
MKSSKGNTRNKTDVSQDLGKIGKRIKELHIAKGYSSHETFAYENDFNRPQYGRYERGEDLRVSTLLRVMKALGVTPEEFFEGFE